MKRAAILALVMLAGPRAHASSDYLIDEPGWNGLALLAGLARGLSFDVVVRSSLQWTELEANDVVFILYPTKKLDPANVVAFIRNGGRVLIADDFGRADETIERLSMLRRRQTSSATDYYDRLPFAPEAHPVSSNHPLARGVDKLTCNHPAFLTNVAGPDVVFETATGEAVVVSGAVGSGSFVVLSDPSVLINRMLEFDGNLQFTTNLLTYLRRGTTGGRLVILAGGFDLRGRPTAVLDHQGDDSIAGINRWLESLNDYFLTESSLRIVGAGILLLIGLFALASAPLRRRPTGAKVADWTRIRGGRPSQRHISAIVSEYEHSRRGTSYELPAAVVRDRLRDILTDHGVAEPLAPEAREATLELLRDCGGSSAVAAFREIEELLRRLPTRSQAMIGWQPTFVSKREFEQLARNANQLYRSLSRD